jgi:O-antigen/teichoic acid export membrane protein
MAIVFHLEHKNARINIVNSMFNFTLNIILIPIFGIIGASIATVATELLGMFQFGIILRSYYKWIEILKNLLGPALAAFFMGVIVFITQGMFHIWTIFFGAIVYITVAYILRVWSFNEIKMITKLIPKGNISR